MEFGLDSDSAIYLIRQTWHPNVNKILDDEEKDIKRQLNLTSKIQNANLKKKNFYKEIYSSKDLKINAGSHEKHAPMNYEWSLDEQSGYFHPTLHFKILKDTEICEFYHTCACAQHQVITNQEHEEVIGYKTGQDKCDSYKRLYNYYFRNYLACITGLKRRFEAVETSRPRGPPYYHLVNLHKDHRRLNYLVRKRNGPFKAVRDRGEEDFIKKFIFNWWNQVKKQDLEELFDFNLLEFKNEEEFRQIVIPCEVKVGLNKIYQGSFCINPQKTDPDAIHAIDGIAYSLAELANCLILLNMVKQKISNCY